MELEHLRQPSAAVSLATLAAAGALLLSACESKGGSTESTPKAEVHTETVADCRYDPNAHKTWDDANISNDGVTKLEVKTPNNPDGFSLMTVRDSQGKGVEYLSKKGWLSLSQKSKEFPNGFRYTATKVKTHGLNMDMHCSKQSLS